MVLLNRKNRTVWSKAFPARENGTNLSTNTQTVYDYLKEYGASFFVDIVSSTNLLPSMVEEALGEVSDPNARLYTHEEVMQVMQERNQQARSKLR